MGGREGGRTGQTQTTLKGSIRFDFSNREVEEGKNEEKKEGMIKGRMDRMKEDIPKKNRKTMIANTS